MNKKDLAAEAVKVLRKSKAKKPVKMKKRTFYISDEEGNTRSFSLTDKDKMVYYTVDDVKIILDAIIEVIGDAVKRGEDVYIKGFGTFGVKYRKQRKTKDIITKEEIIIPGHYIPKFLFGKDLKMCAQIYDMMLDDKPDLPDQMFDRIFEPEDGEY